MWLAQFVSNVGGWMQTVGAQWLMLSLTTAAAPVALIQTASSLPVLLFAVPAGEVGDLVDRRRFLIGAQTFMALTAAALGALAIAGLVTPLTLLVLLFALGAGQAVSGEDADGPVMVSVEYRPREELCDQFLAELYDTRFSRRRTGASSWRMWRDSNDPGRLCEQFVVGSWEEHLRQHERVSGRDSQRLQRIAAMLEPDHPPLVTHWLTPKLDVSGSDQQDER
jgi:hypothetical protein